MLTQEMPIQTASSFQELAELHERILRSEESLRAEREIWDQSCLRLQDAYEAELAEMTTTIEQLRLGIDPSLNASGYSTEGAASNSDEFSAKITRLEHENSVLKSQLKESDQMIEQLKAYQVPGAETAIAEDVASCEAELAQSRSELERERRQLRAELEQVRARNEELNDVVRQAELELSKERAQLARERSQLDRMRQEIRHNIEREQRDATVNQKLATINKLKDEVAERAITVDQNTPLIKKKSLWNGLIRR